MTAKWKPTTESPNVPKEQRNETRYTQRYDGSDNTQRTRQGKHSSAFDYCLDYEWEGDKGETYSIGQSKSNNAWVCTRWGSDGSSKQFSLALEKHTGKIWWGIAGAYYCDLGSEESDDALSWYKPHASKPSFVWWARKQGAKKTDEPAEWEPTNSWHETGAWTHETGHNAPKWTPTLRHQATTTSAESDNVRAVGYNATQTQGKAAALTQQRRWKQKEAPTEDPEETPKDVPQEDRSREPTAEWQRKETPTRAAPAKVAPESRAQATWKPVAAREAPKSPPSDDAATEGAPTNGAPNTQTTKDKPATESGNVGLKETATAARPTQDAQKQAPEAKDFFTRQSSHQEESCKPTETASKSTQEAAPPKDQQSEKEQTSKHEQKAGQPTVGSQTAAGADAQRGSLLEAIKQEFQRAARKSPQAPAAQTSPTTAGARPAAKTSEDTADGTTTGASTSSAAAVPGGVEAPPGLPMPTAPEPQVSNGSSSTFSYELAPPPGLPMPTQGVVGKSDDETCAGSNSTTQADDADVEADAAEGDKSQPRRPARQPHPKSAGPVSVEPQTTAEPRKEAKPEPAPRAGETSAQAQAETNTKAKPVTAPPAPLGPAPVGQTNSPTSAAHGQSLQAADGAKGTLASTQAPQPVVLKREQPPRAGAQEAELPSILAGAPKALSQAGGKPKAHREAQASSEADSSKLIVILDKTRGTALGVTMDQSDGLTLHIDSISKEGLFHKWNKSNPNNVVRATDRIVEVNGVRGNVATLVEQLKMDKVHKIHVERGGLANEEKDMKAKNSAASKPSSTSAVSSSKKEKQQAKQQMANPNAPAPQHDSARMAAAAAQQVADLAARWEAGLSPFQQATRTPARSMGVGRQGAAQYRGPLDGRWHDKCGVIGTIKGMTLYWAHPVVGTSSTQVDMAGTSVRMSFLGQTLSGVLSGDLIQWSQADVWWRDN